jgi:hypothetical protein
LYARKKWLEEAATKSWEHDYAVEYLADLQTNRGDWQNELPFYQTLNALAHLDLAQADTQLEKAFKWLFENQNSDDTLCRYEPEWHTFLAIHALKNKGLL